MAQSEHIIKNYDMLLSHGETKTRKVALDIAEAAIQRAIPYHETLRLIRRTPESISIGERTIFLREIDHIYVVGVGKGAYPIAQALEEKLGDLIDEGIVLVKKGDTRRLKRIEIIESGHPLPDQAGIDGAKKILSILQKAGERDLIFAPITGGSSAMMNLPCGRITLEDLRKINDALLKSGASIGKMNAVRKHLCKMKGGHLVEYAKPAEIHTLTLDTAPPDMPWPDLSLADPTTFQDAINMMKEYAIWDEAPASIREHLLEGLAHPEMETPKKLTNTRAYIHSVADPRSTCVAAANKAKELGYTPYVLSTALEGDACNLGIFFSGIANEVTKTGRPFAAPCAIISAGETTVTIHGPCGAGGPNQETALGYPLKLHAQSPTVCLSMDSDGTDGPSDIAGGISDNQTFERACELGLNLWEMLGRHDSSTALLQLNDALITGHTGTNIMNFRVVVIEKKENES